MANLTGLTLNPLKRKRKNPTGIPIDSQGSSDLAQLAAQRLNFLDQYNQNLSDINRNFRIQRRNLTQQEPYTQRGILNDFAGRGMAFSTGYGSALGREQQLYQQGLGDLGYQHTLGVNDLRGQRLQFNRTYLLQQQAIRQAAADRLAQQAATLNLYKSKKPLTATQIAKVLGGNGG